MLHVAALTVLCLYACVWMPAATAQNVDLATQLNLHGGQAIYHAACAACHGGNGEGAPQASAGFDRPDSFPHFNKCDETTPEFSKDYHATIRDGGPARGFSPIMPAFKGVLTEAQIKEVVIYLRSLCTETAWPLGELNVPRALATEKAFPESEAIVTTTVNAKGPATIDNEFVYERVLGKHDQLELSIPFSWLHTQTADRSGGMTGGLGDIAIGDKHIVYSHLNAAPGQVPYEASGSIFSVQGEVVLATGDQRRGLGAGEPALGLFAMYDHVWSHQTFLQTQTGVDIPRHAEFGPSSAYVRTAFGKSFNVAQGFGRMWTPMLEVTADRDLQAGATTDWDVIPELQVTLNKRQHIRAALGYRVPINDTADRPKQFMAYFLWDWFDGGLFEGW